MSLKKLVEPECGGANSLVSLSSHFLQDRALKDEAFHPFSHPDSFTSANADQLVHEFLEETSHAAQPFRMDSLLAEMRELESRAGPVRSASVSQLATEGDVQEWAQQYIDSGKHFQENTGPGIWSSDLLDSEDSLELGLGPKWADEYLQRTQPVATGALDETPTLADLSNSEEYDDKTDALAETAGEILESTTDDQKFAFSKFMKFMKQINEGEVTIDSNGKVQPVEGASKAEHWSLEYEQDQEPASKWTEQFLRSEGILGEEGLDNSNESINNLKLWDKIEAQLREFTSEIPEYKAWDSEFNDFSAEFKEYNFSKENPMSSISDPLEEGKRMLLVGDLPSAVLCFEVAAQQQPDNPLAWQLLGTTQAENEQDPQAIAALKKCILLQSDNLTALLALSVCYTNENYQNQACQALKEWLRMNPKYSDIVPKDDVQQPRHFPGISSVLSREMFNHVKELFLEAARRYPQDVDPDVQCGLGVLFNISLETDLAVDCFKAAVQVRPNDAALWNRLGATLANGDRSEEAVDAYRSALQLQPGFIRARYNLGITCVHLGAYREAAEHLLTALKQQSTGRGPQGETKAAMSDTIWNTLKLVVTLVDRMDLTNDVNQRNLSKLNEEFGIE